MITGLRWAAVFAGVLAMGAAHGKEARVLDGVDIDAPPERMLSDYLLDRADAAFEARRERFEALETQEDIEAYQEEVRAYFRDKLFPETWGETALNAKVVDTLDRDGYRVDKVIFWSMALTPVTGLLFLPEGEGPHPAVLIPCGHAAEGKAAEAYQRAAILLAKNGMAAFVYDPIGQGERYQLLDENGEPVLGATHEHTMLGVGAILLGLNTASYRVWDGVRALDYLESRDDIDGGRLACAGNSGGGTVTSYLMALDERIIAAAPSCYITSMERLVHTIGPQDAEQNIHGQIAFGMEHADYIHLAAPHPVLICAATDDFFDIEGTWDSFREAKQLYTKLGHPERVDIAEAAGGHGWHKPLREAMARWMSRWLLDKDEPITEPDFEILTPEEAQVTPDGQVLLMGGGRSKFALHEMLLDHMHRLGPEELLHHVRRITGIRPLDERPREAPEVVERIEPNLEDEAGENAFIVEKLVFRPEPGIVLPARFYEPRNGGTGAPHLYLAADGMAPVIGPNGPIVQLLDEGHSVLTVDVRGIGETRGEDQYGGRWPELFGVNWQDMFLAYMLDTSYLAMRAEDIQHVAAYLRERSVQRAVNVIATGELGPPALHAAALEPFIFGEITLIESIESWASVIEAHMAPNQLVNAIQGALRYYDLPHLAALAPPDSVRWERPVTLD